MRKLLELQAWCRREGMPLLVEIIIMRNGEDEHEFEERGRPTLLAALSRQSYRRGLVPHLGKSEGPSSPAGAAIIDVAIRERPEPRQLILGKGADTTLIEQWFDAASALPSTAGFAIGRSVFWRPCITFLKGQLSPESASDTMAASYLDLIDQWNRRAVTT